MHSAGPGLFATLLRYGVGLCGVAAVLSGSAMRGQSAVPADVTNQIQLMSRALDTPCGPAAAWAPAGETTCINEYLITVDHKPWHVDFWAEHLTSDPDHSMETMCAVDWHTDIDLAQVDPERILTGGDAHSHWVQLVSTAPASGMTVASYMNFPMSTCYFPKGPVPMVQLDFKTSKGANDAAKELRKIVVLARKAEPAGTVPVTPVVPAAPAPAATVVPPAPAWPATLPAPVESLVKAIAAGLPPSECPDAVPPGPPPCMSYELNYDTQSGRLSFGEQIHASQMVGYKSMMCDAIVIFLISPEYIDPALIRTGGTEPNLIDMQPVINGTEPAGPWVQLVGTVTGAIANHAGRASSQQQGCAMPATGDVGTVYLPFATTQARDAAAATLRVLVEQAQTTLKTFDWIRTTLVACGYTRAANGSLQHGIVVADASYDIEPSYVFYQDGGIGSSAVAESLVFGDISSVKYDPAGYNGRLVFTGKVKPMFGDPAGSEASMELNLYDHAEAGPLLVKAFRYLAEVNGAKLVDSATAK